MSLLSIGYLSFDACYTIYSQVFKASIIPQLFKHFGIEKAGLDCYGRSRDWNIDLIPKFLMADGEF